ncbi:MAG TPA: magnesium/cobalt transporter CorA [Thermoanaerobaculia bacterium]|nr:magnesium/cobalt transporter CorA [Thermoanaerobaculia bacterium]
MIVDCAVYEDGVRRGGELSLKDAFEAGRPENAFVWIGLHEPSEEEFAAVRAEFGLHELAVEDAIKAHQRPKLEVYGDSIFVVLKTAWYKEDVEEIELGEILLFIGDGFVVTVRHGPASGLAEVRKRLERSPELLRLGPGAILYAILDRVVDDYKPVILGLENDIADVEEKVFSEARGGHAERIYFLKREALMFHQAVAPLVPAADRLSQGRYEAIPEGIQPYFRDIHDHLLRVVDRLVSFRDLLTSILEANLTQVNVRQNEDMRKISAWVAILAVPTMIAGIYGMNFEHMPEIKFRYGYYVILGVMFVACGALYRHFKKSGWL